MQRAWQAALITRRTIPSPDHHSLPHTPGPSISRSHNVLNACLQAFCGLINLIIPSGFSTFGSHSYTTSSALLLFLHPSFLFVPSPFFLPCTAPPSQHNNSQSPALSSSSPLLISIYLLRIPPSCLPPSLPIPLLADLYH